MSLLSRLRIAMTAEPKQPRESWRALIRPIGTASSQCPYCAHRFDRMPQRKRKCPGCGDTFYSRKRPFDGLKVLLTEAEAAQVEAQSAILELVEYGGVSENDVSRELESLKRARPDGVTIHDALEHLLQWRARETASRQQWGLHRSARFQLGMAYKGRGRAAEALDAFLEVCCLDLNGPHNCASTDPHHLKRYPPFDPARGELLPTILAELNGAAKGLLLSTDAVCDRFRSVAILLKQRCGTPRSPEDACVEFRKALEREKAQ